MQKVTKQEHWDMLLVSKYRRYPQTMAALVITFAEKYKPEFIVDNRINEKGLEWFNGLELKRCRDRTNNGDVVFISWTMPLDTFIGVHSLSLQTALEQCLTGKQDKADVLNAIHLYKWVRRNLKNSTERKRKKAVKNKKLFRSNWEKNNEGKKYGSRLTINFRENDRENNWSTVK
ncbi:MAG: hypothetical protein CMP00_04875 [Woeseiaceae bacterium]|nr:hypothetical protein [Woeseiaceae bacterium]